ncbi:hypothetical protein [Streptosporangium carneum]|uniref:hypothetical protein n=1 Tax=Streptosporangium carneum TaxID=47481 RepID=UPI0022F2CD87|nr:hypothetical protein [Streptosporangium carneum]
MREDPAATVVQVDVAAADDGDHAAADEAVGVFQDGGDTEGRRGLDDQARMLQKRPHARDDGRLSDQDGVIGHLQEVVQHGGDGVSNGDAVPLTEIKDGDPEQVQIFTKLGLRHYRKSPLSLPELCNRSVGETVRTSGVAPTDVGAVLLATTVNSIHAVGLDYPEVAQILGDHGLIDTKLCCGEPSRRTTRRNGWKRSSAETTTC